MADGNSLPLYFTGREWLCVNFGIKVRYGKAWRSLHRPGEGSNSENDFLGIVIFASGWHCIFLQYQPYHLQELQEMVLEADIDGDGQVTEICTFFWPDLYQICAFVTRFLGDLRGVPCHDDCWIVCFLFRSSCCLKIQFPFFPLSDWLHLLPYWIPGGLIGAGAVWTKQDHQIYFSTSDPSLGPTLLPTDQLSHWNGNVRGRQVQTHRLWISNYKGLQWKPLGDLTCTFGDLARQYRNPTRRKVCEKKENRESLVFGQTFLCCL